MAQSKKLNFMKTNLFGMLVLLIFNIHTNAQSVSTLAGSGTAGSVNGTGASASFNYPTGVGTDVSGNVYVADYFNNKIRKITPSGVVTTFAGSGNVGSLDGTGTSARFYRPLSLTVDTSGNVYVADTYNSKIRKITPTGDVTTLAGGSTAGNLDGTGSAASFYWPTAVAVDASGNVYVADTNNNLIRKVTSSGVVTTIAGDTTVGSVDANGTAASFSSPNGIAVDSSGNIFVSDFGNQKIRKISPTGDVTTFAGNGSTGNLDGLGTSATFDGPSGITIDVSGNLYVADRNNNLIRKITSNGNVTTYAGDGSAGSIDATPLSSSFNTPYSVAADISGNIFVADFSNHKIRQIVNNLSYKSQKLGTHINIYPNPVGDIINIDLAESDVVVSTLYDSLGKQILSKKLNFLKNSINVSQLPLGIYFLKIEDDKGVAFQKILKQ